MTLLMNYKTENMEILTLAHTSQRHADTFTENAIVFEAVNNGRAVQVVAKSWNANHKTFHILLNDEKVTATSNFAKAIGLAVLSLNNPY